MGRGVECCHTPAGDQHSAVSSPPVPLKRTFQNKVRPQSGGSFGSKPLISPTYFYSSACESKTTGICNASAECVMCDSP